MATNQPMSRLHLSLKFLTPSGEEMQTRYNCSEIISIRQGLVASLLHWLANLFDYNDTVYNESAWMKTFKAPFSTPNLDFEETESKIPCSDDFAFKIR